MKSKLARTGIVVLSIAIITTGIIIVFHNKIKAHFIPSVEQIGEIHVRVKDDTSYISTRLVVTNRSFLKIKIDTIKYKVGLFNKTYIQNNTSLAIVLPGHGKDSLDFSLKIPYASILKDLKAERKKEDSAGYSVNVFLQYSTSFWHSELPIAKSGKLKIPQPPELKIDEIKWKKIHLKSLTADVKIKITNYSPVVLSIQDLNYSLNIKSQGDLKGKYREPITIKPKGVTFITVPIEITTTNIGKTVFDVIMNRDNYEYTLRLNALLESTDPDKKTFTLDLTKTGNMELRK
jgi:LEA14-like dessication related protein